MNTEAPFLFRHTQDLPKVNTPRGPRFVAPVGYRNLRLDLSWNGSAFQGYQMQPHVKSVQYVINCAWQILTGERVALFGCSRLDAGVHAGHFVLNLFTQTKYDHDRIIRALNGIFQQNLQEPITILRAEEMPSNFNARFDTVGKHYRYRLWYGRGQHALHGQRYWNVRSNRALSPLEDAVSLFEGTHDFAAFRSQDCAASSTVRTLNKVDVWHHPRLPEMLVVDFWGEGFLKNMIRNLIGTAVDVTKEKLALSSITDAFDHGLRHHTGQCAPAHGLTLENVYYNHDSYAQDIKDGLRYLIS